MAGLQNIIDGCNGINIDRRKVVGIQYTRNEIPRVSQTPTKNPWKITLDMPNSYRYNEARSLMEALDSLDRTQPEVVTFSSNSKLDWIFAYQGQMTSGQIGNLTIDSYVGSTLVLSTLPSVGSGTILFKPNDLIQIEGYPYPFTSVNTITRGSASTVSVQTSRPNIISDSVVGLGVIVGNDCSFNMFCPNMPTYNLVVGGQQTINGVVTNNALIEFSDNFQLFEFVGDA
jgi:hypothetical protein